jgi:hypothetical protein
MIYDADRAPDPAEWRGAAEPDRLAAVEAHHRGLAQHARTPKPRLHAAIHLVVEDQLLREEPPEVRRALSRLLAGGLTRHEALHAIGLLVSEVMAAAMEGRRYDPAAYARELEALDAEGWRRLAAEGESTP